MPIIIKMYPGGLYALIKDVISSWEVIVVTLAMLLFLKIVFYVSSSYRKPIAIKKMIKKKKPKPEPAAAAAVNPEESQGGDSSNSELGLEEA
jgi:hypothetical protein